MKRDEIVLTLRLFEKHASMPYNPLIANAFFRAGLIEAWGRGIYKIIEDPSVRQRFI
jgi:ATP-dependent DNA helicase RecG